jgi:hypothetical protein
VTRSRDLTPAPRAPLPIRRGAIVSGSVTRTVDAFRAYPGQCLKVWKQPPDDHNGSPSPDRERGARSGGEVAGCEEGLNDCHSVSLQSLISSKIERKFMNRNSTKVRSCQSRTREVLSCVATAIFMGCGSDMTTGTPPTYPGTTVLGATPIQPAFGMNNNTPGTIQVSISSEGFGQRGFDYTAMPSMGDIVLVDGWEVRFSRILVTVKNARLNRPGPSPTDQSSVGTSVAINPNAYAVNIQKAGPITGAGGGEETAIPLFVFATDAQGQSLNTTTRYALSYDTVAASMMATNVNLDAGDLVAYQNMITRGWTQLIEGTATYRGTTFPMTSPWASYPTEVRFSFGFGAPAGYVNCYNPDNGGDDVAGVQPSASGKARAQLTFHMDHMFWEALGREDPPLHFDHFAARAQNVGGVSTVTLDDLAGVAPSNLRDRMMRVVEDRGAQTSGYTARNPAALSLDLGGTSNITDVRDFVVFSTRASGHLNADGLCAVRPSGMFRY